MGEIADLSGIKKGQITDRKQEPSNITQNYCSKVTVNLNIHPEEPASTKTDHRDLHKAISFKELYLVKV